jgi:hypothetical protein
MKRLTFDDLLWIAFFLVAFVGLPVVAYQTGTAETPYVTSVYIGHGDTTIIIAHVGAKVETDTIHARGDTAEMMRLR